MLYRLQEVCSQDIACCFVKNGIKVISCFQDWFKRDVRAITTIKLTYGNIKIHSGETDVPIDLFPTTRK